MVFRIRVRHDTPPGKLAQSLARALREHPVVEMSAVGMAAIDIASLGQAAVEAMMPRPWMQVYLMPVTYGEKERMGRRYIIARDLACAAVYEASVSSQLRQQAE